MTPYRRSNPPSLELSPSIPFAAQEGLEATVRAMQQETASRDPTHISHSILKVNAEIQAFFYCRMAANRLSQGASVEQVLDLLLPEVGKYCGDHQKDPRPLPHFLRTIQEVVSALPQAGIADPAALQNLT